MEQCLDGSMPRKQQVVHIEVGTRVNQESQLTDLARDEEAAGRCSADVCRR
jgi:hypothetical protein